MKKFFALMSVSVQALLTSTTGNASRAAKRKKNGKKSRAVRVSPALGAALLIAFIGLYISGVYSMMLLSVLRPMKMEILLFIFMGLGTLVMGIMYTSFAVKTTVYGGEDNDLLLSMPVSSTTLMLSRVTAIYLESLLVTFFMLAPAGAMYLWKWDGGIPAKIAFIVRLLLVIFCLPMLDTTISLLVGACLAWISSKITGRSFGHTLVMGVFLAAVFWFSFRINDFMESLARNADKIKDALNWIKPLIWMGDGIMGDWKELLFFMLVCIIPFVLTVFILGKLYKKAVTMFSAQKAKNDYKLGRQHRTGASRALFKKEAERFFGSATYFWNAALGLVMMAAAGIFLLIKKNTILPYVEMIEDHRLIILIVMGFIGALLSLNLIAAPSISLEGKNLWLIREAPVTSDTLLMIKTGFELIVTAPCLLITLVCLGLMGIFTPVEMLQIICFAILFAVAHACFGMLVGLRFARLDEPNENYVIKRSLLAFLAIFAPGAMLAAVGIIGFILSLLIESLNAVPTIHVLWMVFAFLFALITVTRLRLKGEKLLARLGE